MRCDAMQFFPKVEVQAENRVLRRMAQLVLRRRADSGKILAPNVGAHVLRLAVFESAAPAERGHAPRRGALRPLRLKLRDEAWAPPAVPEKQNTLVVSNAAFWELDVAGAFICKGTRGETGRQGDREGGRGGREKEGEDGGLGPSASNRARTWQTGS